jgi:hypothetical protein
VPGSIRLLRSNAAAIASAAHAHNQTVVQLAQNEHSERLELVPSIDPFMQGTSVISPLISKLHSESGLRPFAMEVYVHPETASSRGLADRAVAALESNLGRIEVSVRIDTSVARGLVIAPRSSNDPSALSLFTSSTTSVKLSKV